MSSMQGHYSDTGLPIIEIPIHAKNEYYRDIEFVIDSGFSRGLVIYDTDANVLGLPPSRRFDNTLYVANGEKWPAEITTGIIRWCGRPQQVDLIVVKSDRSETRRAHKEPERGLVGMEFLRGTRVLLGASEVLIALEGD